MLKQLVTMLTGNAAMTAVGLPMFFAGIFGAISAFLKGGMPDGEDMGLIGAGLLGIFGRSGGNGSQTPTAAP